MVNIVRREPFREPFLRDPFDVAFPEFFRSLMRPMRFEMEPGVEIRLDLKETADAYKVHAEIPGVKKEDIEVTIDGNTVSISAEVKREKETKDEKTLRTERYYGAVSRTFTLGSDVDDKTATAKYADGVLELTLPKKPGGKTKHLTVS